MGIAVRDVSKAVSSNINVTPMVDVMLVLLIIFMVITPMLQNKVQVDMAKVGQMPVNKAAMTNADALAAMPLLPVFAEALKTAKARPVTPKWGDMENIIATKVAEAITGQKAVQKALDEAATEIDALIAAK